MTTAGVRVDEKTGNRRNGTSSRSGAGGGTGSGSGRATPNSNSRRGSAFDAGAGLRMRNRMLHLYTQALWTTVVVTVRNGSKFRGYLSAVDVEGDVALSLFHATQIVPPASASTHPIEELVIKADNLVALRVLDLDVASMTANEAAHVTSTGGGFRTDTDISAGRLSQQQQQERLLQRWVPDEADDKGALLSLDSAVSKNTSWDQFSANERLFGVKSDYDEEIYTTRIDRSRADFKEREARAAQLAREIESQTATAAHIAEDRNQQIEDSGLTEEDLYSGVMRGEQKSTPGPSPPPPPASTAATNSVVPPPLNDPAIISTSQEMARVASPSVRAPTETKAHADGAHITSSLQSQFKQFATSERERINQRKERSSMEKGSRLRDLKLFSENFKLKTPVPDDLLPILSKGRAKHDEPVAKLGVDAEKTVQEPLEALTSDGSAPSSLGQRMANMRLQREQGKEVKPSASPTPLSPAESTRAKLNVNASSFKPNPNAVAFNPSKSFSPNRGAVAAPAVRLEKGAGESSKASSSDSKGLSPGENKSLETARVHASSAPRQSASPHAFFVSGRERAKHTGTAFDNQHYNPYKRFKAANPTSSDVIERPHTVPPLWNVGTDKEWRDQFPRQGAATATTSPAASGPASDEVPVGVMSPPPATPYGVGMASPSMMANPGYYGAYTPSAAPASVYIMGSPGADVVMPSGDAVGQKQPYRMPQYVQAPQQYVMAGYYPYANIYMAPQPYGGAYAPSPLQQQPPQQQAQPQQRRHMMSGPSPGHTNSNGYYGQTGNRRYQHMPQQKPKSTPDA